MSSFARRVATAAVLIPLVVGSIFALPTGYLALVFAVVILGAAWEWSGLMGWTSPARRWMYTLAFIPVLYAAYDAASVSGGGFSVLAIGLLWWFGAAVWVLRFQKGQGIAAWRAAPVRAVTGLLILVPAWVALIVLHGAGEAGPSQVLFLLALIWVADTSAYLVGRRWGSRRLASRVSPGKTWEGVAAGLVAAAVLAALLGRHLGIAEQHRPLFMLLCIAMVPISILGDLAESLFKRQAGVKDSGSVLPGHGGVLDRIDSLTSAAPFFVLGLAWLDTWR